MWTIEGSLRLPYCKIAKDNKCTARRLDEYLRTIISSPTEVNKAGIEGKNL